MTPNYKKRLIQGLYYQDIIVEELYKIGLPIISYSSKEFQYNIGENKGGIEIKNDDKFRETGNFYIEHHEKTHPDNEKWIESGILRDDNTWLYVIGDLKEFFIFSKKQLKILYNSGKYKINVPVKEKTALGMLLPCEDALKHYSLKNVIILE